MLEYIAFLSCLEFAVLNSLYCDTIFKPKQVICLENIFLQKDVLCILPTGYGKSLIFHLAPMLLFAKSKLEGDFIRCWKSKGVTSKAVNAIVIVVSPLNSLMSNQISRLSSEGGIRASVLSVKVSEESEENIAIDFGRLCEKEKLRDGFYQIVFAHPESFISTKYGRELLMTKVYQENVVAIVVDEAHCILDWLVYLFIVYIIYILLYDYIVICSSTVTVCSCRLYLVK